MMCFGAYSAGISVIAYSVVEPEIAAVGVTSPMSCAMLPYVLRHRVEDSQYSANFDSGSSEISFTTPLHFSMPP